MIHPRHWQPAARGERPRLLSAAGRQELEPKPLRRVPQRPVTGPGPINQPPDMGYGGLWSLAFRGPRFTRRACGGEGTRFEGVTCGAAGCSACACASLSLLGNSGTKSILGAAHDVCCNCQGTSQPGGWMDGYQQGSSLCCGCLVTRCEPRRTQPRAVDTQLTHFPGATSGSRTPVHHHGDTSGCVTRCRRVQVCQAAGKKHQQ